MAFERQQSLAMGLMAGIRADPMHPKHANAVSQYQEGQKRDQECKTKNWACNEKF